MDLSPSLDSPLDPVFAGHAAVPFAFAEQFFHSAELPYGVRLEGVMHRVWHRPRMLGPLFRVLGRMGILVPYEGTEVPATLTVRPGRNRRDGVCHVWDRTFGFAMRGRGVGEASDMWQAHGSAGRRLARRPPGSALDPTRSQGSR